jgi:uncharacterized protein (DUF736 family)
MNNKREKVGAVWVKKTKNNEQYLSINIKIEDREFNFIAFKNNKKKKEKQPFFYIYPSLRQQKEQKEQVVKDDEL